MKGTRPSPQAQLSQRTCVSGHSLSCPLSSPACAQMAPLILCPMRCFSCGGEVCWKNEQYRELLRGGMEAHEALDAVHAVRLCCRRMLLSQPNHIALLRGGGVAPLSEHQEQEQEQPPGAGRTAQ